MKIISKYNDYYDSIMRMGFDDSIVFVRKGAEDDPIPLDVSRNYRWRSGDVNNEGKYVESVMTRLNSSMLYSDWFEKTKRDTIHNTCKMIGNWFEESKKYRNCTLNSISYNIFGFCGSFYVNYEVVYNNNNDITNKKFFITREDHTAFKKNTKSNPVIGEVPDMFTGDVNQMFLDLDCPIFLIHNFFMYSQRYGFGRNGDTLIRNPVLKDFKFQKFVDPYTAYQEIAMFLGSVFANDEDNMVSISDESKAASKGFDKWSFRKPPSKKRRA